MVAKRDAPTYRRNQSARTGSVTLRMKIDPSEKFATLAQQCIEAADQVDCSIEEYIDGLRYILGEVEIAIQAAKETDGRAVS